MITARHLYTMIQRLGKWDGGSYYVLVCGDGSKLEATNLGADGGFKFYHNNTEKDVYQLIDFLFKF